MSIPEIFAENVFNEKAMKQALSPDVYRSLKKAVNENEPLDFAVAQEVADAMKDWAISKGATHYTHWFQPMTGITAEKHDSFISPVKGGGVIMEFSGKALIKGEPDASSFPNGGIRATFEARGYTAWDPSSYAFIKDNTLCIPTAFCSYSGEALDKKTPLIRSLETLNKKAVKVLHLLGKTDVNKVLVTVGAEQEYFLIDRETALKRDDIVFTGRTLFGANPPKGQELGDHYFGAIKPRVKSFMESLNRELWKLGILAKTEHNEVAPAQHELAPIFTLVNTATDHNQLTMEIMKKIAERHGLMCLLAEKPFKGVNGSGKHNNWSLTTDTGVNLLDPGETPAENLQFLLFLCATIKAVDEYQDILRASVASAGNDHRLGAHEAPPAIISVFLGEDLSNALNAFIHNDTYRTGKSVMRLGAKILPPLPKDTTDRNRTSPLAFTGNKFEFRMVGSNDSIADCNVVLNTAVAESLDLFAKELENSKNITETVHNIVAKTIEKNGRIIFNGNNYSDEWTKEAESRGLLNLRTTPEAVCYYTAQKNVELFEKHKVLSNVELNAIEKVMLDNYSRIVKIEALTMIDMARKNIYPAINNYSSKVLSTAMLKASNAIPNATDISLASKLSALNDGVFEKAEELSDLVSKSNTMTDSKELAYFIKDKVLPCMESLRSFADNAQMLTDEKDWPYPSYAKLLFSVK